MNKDTYEMIISCVAENYEDDFFFAYDTRDDEVRPFSFFFDYDYDEDYCINIPRTSSEEAYQLMVSYVRDTQDIKHASQFERVLSMKRPFARFNELLQKYNQVENFNIYQREVHKSIVDDWMRRNELFIDGDEILDFPDWQKNFKKQILQRGLDYYLDDKVTSVRVYKDEIIGKIFNYNISIKYENNKIKKMYCDCPCDFNCKHEAAVMFYITSEMVRKSDSISESNQRSSVDYQRVIRSYFDSINDEDDFLLKSIKSYFESDATDKVEFLDEITNKTIYSNHYCSTTRNNIMKYLIDKAHELSRIETLLFILKTCSFEEYKSKVISILKDNYQNDDRAIIMLKEEEIMDKFLSTDYEQ